MLTVLIVVWAIDTTKSYLLEPVTAWAREGLVWCLADIREDLPLEKPGAKTAEVDGQIYRQLDNGTFIPQAVYEKVQRQPGESPPTTGEGYYRRYVDLTYLRPYIAIPFFLAVFVLLLYFLGKVHGGGHRRVFRQRLRADGARACPACGRSTRRSNRSPISSSTNGRSSSRGSSPSNIPARASGRWAS